MNNLKAIVDESTITILGQEGNYTLGLLELILDSDGEDWETIGDMIKHGCLCGNNIGLYWSMKPTADELVTLYYTK